MGGMPPQAQVQRQGLPEAPEAGGEAWGRFPWQPPEACRHLDFGLALLTCETMNFCCSKPPCLWSFVVAAMGKYAVLHKCV